MNIAIIDCDDISDPQRAHYINYPHMFVQVFDKAVYPISYQVFNALERQLPINWGTSKLAEFDGWLIMGSKFGAYEDYPWIDELKDFIQKLVDARVKLAGVCFGHQIIHQVLGGKVEKSVRGWGIGAHSYHVEKLPPFVEQGPESLTLLVSHQDQVEVPAPDTKVIAQSDFCPCAVSTIGDRIFTSQPHPEFTKDYSKLLMNMRRSIIGDEKVDQGELSLSNPVDSDLILQWLGKFWEA